MFWSKAKWAMKNNGTCLRSKRQRTIEVKKVYYILCSSFDVFRKELLSDIRSLPLAVSQEGCAWYWLFTVQSPQSTDGGGTEKLQ